MHVRKGHKKIENPNEYIKRKLTDLMSEAPKGYLYHEPNENEINFTVRYIRPVTYRLLHLFIHANFYMLYSLKIFEDYDLRNILNLKPEIKIDIYLRKHIESDYNVIRELIKNNDQDIFVHAILYKFPEFLKTYNMKSKEINITNRNEFESNFEKILVDPLLTSVDQIIIDFKKKFSKPESMNEMRWLLNEVDDPKFIESIKEKYPLIEHMRLSQEADINYFKNKFNSLNKDKEFPLIDLYLKQKYELEKLTALPVLTKVTNYLMNKYDHKISRNDVREKKLIQCFDKNDEILKDFEALKTNWRKYLNKPLQEGCKTIPGVELSNDTSPLVLLVDNRLEEGSGIQSRLVIQDLALCQNRFLESLIAKSDSIPYLKNFNREPFLIHLADSSHIIDVKESMSNDMFLGILRAYTLLDPKYGSGMQIDYDYDKIQLNLLNKLVVGKRILNNSKEAIRTVQFSGELMSTSCMINSIRETIQQVGLDEKLIKELNDFIEKPDVDVKEIFSSLETLICFLNSSCNLHPRTKLKQHCRDLGLQNMSSCIYSEPLASKCLLNIVEVYEIFENAMFGLNKTSNKFNDKFKIDLDKGIMLTDYEEFLKKCDGEKFPKRKEVYSALKKLSMRCLLDDYLDETQELYVYLSERVDIWPKDKYESKLENVEDFFPKSIKLQHVLGNMMAILERELGIKSSQNEKQTDHEGDETDEFETNEQFDII